MARKLTRRRFLVAGGATALSAGGALGLPSTASAAWHSQLVYPGADGRLVYVEDAAGNKIPDFSWAGYRNGQEPISTRVVVKTIGPVAGDNTVHIQAALDEVAAMPWQQRGALLLQAGTYPVAGTLRVHNNRMVLRGVGDGADPATNTIVSATGNCPAEREVIVVGGKSAEDWSGEVPGTRTDITSSLVPVGARSFTVASAAALRPGDNIIIRHPCTDAWLQAVDYGATATAPGWSVDELPIVYNRFITAISGNSVTIDAPVYNHLDRALSQAYLYTWDRAHLVTISGVEKLRVDIAYDSTSPENHARTAIALSGTEDCWVRDCTLLHFTFAGVDTSGTTRATVENCEALDPVSAIIGGRRYNFCASANSQQVLFKDCRATQARHAFVSNGRSTTSGIVFLRGTSEATNNTSEGHHRWSQGLLYDGHRELSPNLSFVLGLYNRGDYGTGHGWAAAHSVVWNCDTTGAQIKIQKPPTAQNYAIGCFGTVSGNGAFPHPAGHIEGTNTPGLTPASLYETQLADRT